MVFGIPLSSVYCNTLLANLNARTYIRGTPNGGADVAMMSLPVSDVIKEQSEETKPEFVSSTHEVSAHDRGWLNRP